MDYCTVTGCTNKLAALGLCMAHRWRLKTWGHLGTDLPINHPGQNKLICKVDGCNNGVRSRDMCAKHYTRNQLYGDPLATKKTGKPPRLCDIPGCGRKHHALGLCIMHRLRKQKGQDLFAAALPRGRKPIYTTPEAKKERARERNRDYMARTRMQKKAA